MNRRAAIATLAGAAAHPGCSPEPDEPFWNRDNGGELLRVGPYENIPERDVCIYGATSGGIVAAVQAARMGEYVPHPEQCDDLLVPFALSASHVAFGSTRMEPPFMILGQSAATAAPLACDADTTVQEVNYADLAARLEEDGQILAPPSAPQA